MEKKIFFDDSKGNKVSAIFSNPSDEIVPVIILCHGLNSGKNSNTNLALEKVFSKHDIASFRFDFFAHGESEGKIDDRNIEIFVDDVLCAISYLKNQGFTKFGICGASLGGVASVIAATRSNDLKVMALKSTGMGHTSRIMQNFKHDFDTKSWIKAATNVSIPTLIVHGSADEDVELQLAEDLAASIKTTKFQIFDGADHRFSRHEDFENSVKMISDFIISNIKT